MYVRSQKHESSLGIETLYMDEVTLAEYIVPKSMNPLWGLKRDKLHGRGLPLLVPKSMNPLWGLKPSDQFRAESHKTEFPKA